MSRRFPPSATACPCPPSTPSPRRRAASNDGGSVHERPRDTFVIHQGKVRHEANGREEARTGKRHSRRRQMAAPAAQRQHITSAMALESGRGGERSAQGCDHPTSTEQGQNAAHGERHHEALGKKQQHGETRGAKREERHGRLAVAPPDSRSARNQRSTTALAPAATDRRDSRVQARQPANGVYERGQKREGRQERKSCSAPRHRGLEPPHGGNGRQPSRIS